MQFDHLKRRELIPLLEDIGKDARAAIDREADRLRAWLGETRRVLPRFSTPLVKELMA